MKLITWMLFELACKLLVIRMSIGLGEIKIIERIKAIKKIVVQQTDRRRLLIELQCRNVVIGFLLL